MPGKKGVGKASALAALGVFLFLALAAGGSSPDKAPPFRDPGIPDGETSVLRNRLSFGGGFIYTTQVIHAAPEGLTYRLTSEASNGEQEDQVVTRPDLFLRRVTVRDQAGDLIYSVESLGEKLSVQAPGKETLLRAAPQVVERRTLFLVLRGLSFFPGFKAEFPLFLPEAGVVSVYARVLGMEQVVVPAGTFQAYKVEMGVLGIPGVLTRQYLTYYWFDAKPTHRFLRYEWPGKGQITELARTSLE